MTFDFDVSLSSYTYIVPLVLHIGYKYNFFTPVWHGNQ